MKHTLANIALLCLALLPLAASGVAPVLAQMPAMPPVDEHRPIAPDSLAAYLGANRECREISDGCQICVRANGEMARCSLPGIACQPTGWQCNLPAIPKSDAAEPTPTPSAAPGKQ